MTVSMTIGQLAKTVNVPVSTLRFYEKRGLISAEHRSSGNYRLFETTTIRTLLFIRDAQDAGFTLTDIQRLIGFRNGGTDHCAEVQALIVARLNKTTQQIDSLRRSQSRLQQWLEVCRESQHTGRCATLDQFNRSSIDES